MAGEISNIAGVALGFRPTLATSQASRSGSQRPTAPPGGDELPSAVSPEKESRAVVDSSDATSLDSMVEQAQNKALVYNTTLSFERDSLDGKMYLYVKDKHTGEDLYRIPRKYLADIEQSHDQSRSVDVRI